MSFPTVQTVQLRAWMERIRAGDARARDELLQTTGARLEAMAHQMLRQFPQVRRWADTNDVLQNAVLRLLRSLETAEFDSMRDFYNLAGCQLRRELIDLARRFRGPQHDAAHHYSGIVAEPAAASESSLGELERWEAFHREVESLPVEEREVIGLVFYHNWTQAQVAELFEVHPRTIRRRWQSALLKLHDRLHDLKLI